MAIYHFHGQVISRGTAKSDVSDQIINKVSAVASAAYRAGAKLYDELRNTYHDYTRKNGVIHSEIMLPKHAPREYKNRDVLWNGVERIEKQSNAQLAREFNIALPRELSMQDNVSLVRSYVRKNFADCGMCADFAIHSPDKRNHNPHVHIMVTMRPLNEDGGWGQKGRKEYILDQDGNHVVDKNGRWKSRKVRTTDWDTSEAFERWREAWAESCNKKLEAKGFEARISHKSYEELGIKLVPTKHVGQAAAALERQGVATDRVDFNRAAIQENIRRLRQMFPGQLVTAAELVTRSVSKLTAKPQPAQEFVARDIALGEGNVHGENVQGRTYTPASGVVRQGESLHPKETIFEPSAAQKDAVQPSDSTKIGIAKSAFTRADMQMPIRVAYRGKHGEYGQTLRLSIPAQLRNKCKFELRRSNYRSVRAESLANIRKMEKLMGFIAENKLTTMEDLNVRIANTETKLNELTATLDRMDSVKKNIEQLRKASEVCKLNLPVATEYQNKKLFKASFYAKHKIEIDSFIEAQKLLKYTGKFDETTQPEVFVTMGETLATNRAATVEQIRDAKNELAQLRLNRANIYEVLNVKNPHQKLERKIETVLDQKLQKNKTEQQQVPKFKSNDLER